MTVVHVKYSLFFQIAITDGKAFFTGKHLAVFRSNRGVVRVMSAYCPHLGANMAVGGKVVGADCLECPFHGWKFNGETGNLVDIPYADKG